MARPRPALPGGHGEVLADPPVAEWPLLAESVAVTARGWRFDVAGMPAAELRALARAEAIEAATAFSERLGVAVREPEADPALIAMTGHQPDLYHPGVWIKDFLLQRFADLTGAAAIDLVVDSDGFEAVQMKAPCAGPEVSVCREYLAVGAPDSCYACAPVPSVEEIEAFCRGGSDVLATLPAPAVLRHFASFCGAMGSARPDARNLAELVTFARRRYEAQAETTYLELPLTAAATGVAFARFFVAIALEADRFAEAYNTELAGYRAANRVRSAAQPVPDLERRDGTVELPFWTLSGGRRRGVSVRPDTREVLADGEPLIVFPSGADEAVAALLEADLRLAPKALSLTAFFRLFVADLFIHGVGGGRYDQVTDGVVRRFFGVEPPPFAVTSMTMYLPLGGRFVDDADVERLTRALNALEHNPDRSLGEIDFGTPEERGQAEALAEEKAALVSAIAAPGADKKALGSRIREVNAALALMLEPLTAEVRAELERVKADRARQDILTDRTYPFCLWSPLEIQDKAG